MKTVLRTCLYCVAVVSSAFSPAVTIGCEQDVAPQKSNKDQGDIIARLKFTIHHQANREQKSAGAAHEVKSVNTSDISHKVRLIGAFGKELGEIITIRGKWSRPSGTPKDPGLLFSVSKVGGRPLEVPIVLRPGLIVPISPKGRLGHAVGNMKWEWMAGDGDVMAPVPHDGEVWELIGVETGRTHGYSSEVQDLLGGPQQDPYGDRFITDYKFIGVNRMIQSEKK